MSLIGGLPLKFGGLFLNVVLDLVDDGLLRVLVGLFPDAGELLKLDDDELLVLDDDEPLKLDDDDELEPIPSTICII